MSRRIKLLQVCRIDKKDLNIEPGIYQIGTVFIHSLALEEWFKAKKINHAVF